MEKGDSLDHTVSAAADDNDDAPPKAIGNGKPLVFVSSSNTAISIKNTMDKQMNKAVLEKLPARKLQEPCVFTPLDGTELKTAVNAYIVNSTSAIDTYGLINSWCVGNVVDMSNLFNGKSTFNEDISAWNTSSVTSMAKMFYYAVTFNGNLYWDTSSVTTMYSMFHGASAFNGNISNWDTSSVIVMGQMFRGAAVFNGVIANWDMSSVSIMNNMFYGADAFIGDLANWDTSSVTTMSSMFYGATSFNQDLCAWGNKFPYLSSVDIFTGSACTFQATPNSTDQGPFCASTCLQPQQPGPWKINFIDLSVDFSVDSDQELIMNYEMGKDRQYKALLLEKDCATNATCITINATDPVVTLKNANFSDLTLTYSIDKASIASSSIWNNALSQIELCQVLQLKEGDMVIEEHNREVSIAFNLTTGFEIAGQALGNETINNAGGATNVDDYVEAYKCGGGDNGMDANPNALVPNEDLFVCIRSKSTDVEIESLDEMDIIDPNGKTLEVIDGAVVSNPTFTSISYVSPTEAQVLTRVPINTFDYASITINGIVAMKFASERKLRADVDVDADAKFFGNANQNAFELTVALQPEMVVKEEEEIAIMVNSASSTAVYVVSKGFVVIGMGIASASTIIW